ncbi:uncharacterized protein LOC117175096 [Belonocnema kinseyi]|uniref:uncharacterized protein LOC117175096 n=1 Tax=Belonocnema kinseyi TaxID=2817044 RepID=UPI00143CD1C1|nr:uncharacterized protein LOC117175096 [Belonocnema kinseyi]
MSSQNNSNANHASTSGISTALSEIANNSHAKTNSASTTRLTSFLAPRDLTLGANSVKTEKSKKIYTPNLNAQRKKKEDEPTVAQKNSKGPKNKHKGKGHDRGNKHKSNLIQSSGVFSEGLSEVGGSRSRNYVGYRDSNDRSTPKEALQRTKLNAGHHVDKEEEEQKLKILLRDDFVEEDNNVDYENCPIVLPMIKEGKLFKVEPDVKIESEVKIKVEQEEEEEGKVKTEIIKNAKKKPHEKGQFQNSAELDKKYALNVSQSLENKTDGYFLFRFPDVLPGAPTESEEDQTRPNKNAEPNVPSEKVKTEEQPLLDNLKEGLLGKLQILKSGTARLCLGDHNLVVELGPRVFFREDVVAAKLDKEDQTGELVNLGVVHTNLICTPNWESLT